MEELAEHYAKSCTLSQDKLIADLTTFSCDHSPFISMVVSTRKKGNPNNKIEYFFDSMLKMTSDLSHVEVVCRLDDDDDLAFFHSIRELFGKQVRMRFVIKNTVNGYRNLFFLHTSAYENTTPTSCIIFLTTDDAIFHKKNWDIYFIGFARSHKNNIFFINPSHPHLLNYENKDSFLWHLWYLGPSACLPAVGRRVMAICKNIADKYPGWTPFGNGMTYDSFNEALQYYIYEITRKRPPLAHMPGSLIIEEEKENGKVAAHKEGGLHSFSPVICDSYRRFLSNDSQAIIREMSQTLCHAQLTEDTVSHTFLEKDFIPTLPGNVVIISIIAKPYQEHDEPGFYDQFMQSLLEKTNQLSRIEIIFVMTSHVSYYKKLAKEYGSKVRIVLLHATPGRKNGLSVIDEEMLSRLAPSSKMICLANEAVTFNKSAWDQDIDAINKNHPDNIFFINTHSFCTNNFEEKAVFFWEMLSRGYPGFSQIISRRIIAHIYPYAYSRHVAEGNEYRLDYLFVGAVEYHYWALTHEKRVYMCDDIFVTNQEYDPGNPVFSPGDGCLQFMEPNVQNFSQNVASQLKQLTEMQPFRTPTKIV